MSKCNILQCLSSISVLPSFMLVLILQISEKGNNRTVYMAMRDHGTHCSDNSESAGLTVPYLDMLTFCR